MRAPSRFLWLGAVVVIGLARPCHAQSPYDTLGRVLAPFVGLLAESKKGDHAVSFALEVESATGLPPELAGATGELAIEFPDRVRVSGPFFGQRLTLCRHGETVWVSPGSVLKSLLANPEIASMLPEPDREFKLRPFRLPIPAKQLVFLPALFQVKPIAERVIDGQARNGIEMRLMPELAKSLKTEEWSGQVWVDDAGHPLRLELSHGEMHAALRFRSLQFAHTLAPSTWAPKAAEEGDVLLVPPARYDQLLRALLGERR